MRHAVAAVACAAILLGGCSDDAPSDDGSGPTTTEAPDDPGDAASTTEEVDPTTTAAEDEPEAEDPEATALAARLSEPATYGTGMHPDEAQASEIQTDLCEGVSVPHGWTAEAVQGLSNGTEEAPTTVTVTETLLEFPGADEARAFVTAMDEGQQTCFDAAAESGASEAFGDLVRDELPDVGDGTVTFEVTAEAVTISAALVPVGPRVASIVAYREGDAATPLTPEVLSGVAGRLAG